MDVKLYGTSSAGRDYSIYRTAPSAPDPVRRPPVGSTGTYDQLTLHKTQYPTDTWQFARILAREAARDISSSQADPARIEELRSRVAAGTYTPDARQTARHMLSYS